MLAFNDLQAKEMLEKFWPWGQETKPRGLRNLRLEGLFPHTDHKKVNVICQIRSRASNLFVHYRLIFVCSSILQSFHAILSLF